MMKWFKTRAAALKASAKINTNPAARRIGDEAWAGVGETVMLRDGTRETQLVGLRGFSRWLGETRNEWVAK